MNNQKIPDNAELTEKTKQRIKELLTPVIIKIKKESKHENT
ncbi:Uncharacterised protein [Raoultella ornithinolytica]|nr:Uncharacterised protein [Raoultella ornithinolytica]